MAPRTSLALSPRSRSTASANKITRTDARGWVTTYTIDRLNRTSGERYRDGTKATFAWDSAGWQLSMQDVTGITTYGWDSADRQTSVVDGIGKALTYTLDGTGNRLSLQNPDGGFTTYAWDSASRLSKITNPNAEVTSFVYDLLDREANRVLGNGITTSHTFDPAGRETVLSHRSSAGAALAVYSASYDAVGNRLSVLELDGNRVTYAYDPSYQLVNEQRSGPIALNGTYQYDGVGNRLVMNASGQLTTYQYNPANELVLLIPPTGQPTTSSWDQNGNLALENAGGSLTTYSWETENRLLSVSASTGIETYAYSADGMREEKVTSGGTVFYVRDGQNVLIETDGNLVTQALYTDLPGMWGGKYALRRSGASRFYLPDYQGHERQLADSTQTVTDTLTADAWGVELAASGATVNPFKAFGSWGYCRDNASRLYVRARHLRVDLGRWVSRDPVRHIVDLYDYGANRCTYQPDPSGLGPDIDKTCKDGQFPDLQLETRIKKLCGDLTDPKFNLDAVSVSLAACFRAGAISAGAHCGIYGRDNNVTEIRKLLKCMQGHVDCDNPTECCKQGNEKDSPCARTRVEYGKQHPDCVIHLCRLPMENGQCVNGCDSRITTPGTTLMHEMAHCCGMPHAVPSEDYHTFCNEILSCCLYRIMYPAPGDKDPLFHCTHCK